ncbi:MAG: SAM-dependent methyltransferase ['Waltheria sp.' little leaf phytoplasma]|nr:SAM-dependent methyltransferase ['Waltheria sp.' little leaf phytoplasma]
MNRILFIVSLIKNYNTVADIGTDHGLVLIIIIINSFHALS